MGRRRPARAFAGSRYIEWLRRGALGTLDVIVCATGTVPRAEVRCEGRLEDVHELTTGRPRSRRYSNVGS